MHASSCALPAAARTLPPLQAKKRAAFLKRHLGVTLELNEFEQASTSQLTWQTWQTWQSASLADDSNGAAGGGDPLGAAFPC